MEFKEFKDRFQKNFSSLVSDVDHLFTVEVDPDVLWNLYLDSFPQGTNEVFRVRREYDCSCCRSFIKRFGPVVRIKGGVVDTIWNFQVPDTKFQTVINALDKYIKSCPVSGVFVTKDALQGTTHSLEQLENGTVVTWTHFSLELPSKFVYSGRETLDTVREKNAHLWIDFIMGTVSLPDSENSCTKSNQLSMMNSSPSIN